MAIITAAIYQTWLNRELTGGELASVNAICLQVDRSIKDRLKRTLEQATYTDVIFDAQTTPLISLARYAPITIPGTGATLFKVWLNYQANGNPNGFDADDDLLELYTDYVLNSAQEGDEFGPCLLRRLPGYWGTGWYSPPGRLAQQLTPAYGAVKCTFQGGYAAGSIPLSIVEAACITISKVLGVRRYGMQVGSESWNGYSYNLPGVGMMINGLLGNPDIRGLLEPFVNQGACIG